MITPNKQVDSIPTKAQLSLPEFSDEGKMPPGEHTTDWQNFSSRFGFNDGRRLYLRLLKKFAEDYKSRGGNEIIIGGSFITNKELPSGINFSIDTTTLPRVKLLGLKVPKLIVQNKLTAPLNFLPEFVELENGEQFSARVFFKNNERIGVSDNSIGIVIIRL